VLGSPRIMVLAWTSLRAFAYTLAMSELAVARSVVQRSDAPVREVALTWGRNLCRDCRIEVITRGRDNVDWSQPLVVLSNHQSLVDIPVILAGIGRPFGFVTKKELFRIPAFGTAMSRLGCVEIDRGDRESARRSLAAAARRVREGASIVAFPEGTRSVDGALLPFKKGPFYLVQQSGVSAVPIALLGTRDILPRGSLQPRPGTVQLRVGTPLHCEDDSAQARDELRSRAHEQILRMLQEA